MEGFSYYITMNHMLGLNRKPFEVVTNLLGVRKEFILWRVCGSLAQTAGGDFLMLPPLLTVLF